MDGHVAWASLPADRRVIEQRRLLVACCGEVTAPSISTDRSFNAVAAAASEICAIPHTSPCWTKTVVTTPTIADSSAAVGWPRVTGTPTALARNPADGGTRCYRAIRL
jgi:hypothetical protein